MTWRCALLCSLLLGLAGCAGFKRVTEPAPATAEAESDYARLYPYYVETCALSQIDKKPGFGVTLTGGIGGHNVLYLNNVCRKPDEHYPVLALCDELPPASRTDGVGLSVNAHYRNAMWAVIPGRELLFNGELKPGETLTRERYRQVQTEARRRGIYDGIDFHEEYFRDMPAGFTRDDFRYELSVATDYAIAFGRKRYCARVPVTRAQMVKVKDYLNALNTPYRERQKEFRWNVLTHNCAHVNHNALATFHLWFEWPMDRPLLISAFDFPVPKNEFVNLMRRTNDLPIEDPVVLFRDDEARKMLLQEGRLPTQPGGLMDLGVVQRPNELYATDSPLIFYDDPITGRFQRRFNALMSEPRYFDLRANLQSFGQRYAQIEQQREPVESLLARHPSLAAQAEEFRQFHQRYYTYITRQHCEVARALDQLNGSRPRDCHD